MEDRSLLALARTLLSLDHEMLNLTIFVYKETIRGRLNAHDPEEANKAREELSKAMAMDEQMSSIKLGAASFHSAYLEQRIFVPVWQKAMNIFIQIIPHELGPNLPPDSPQKFNEVLSGVELKTQELVDRILAATSCGSLTEAALLMLEERWVRLDETLNWREQAYAQIRTLPSWNDVAQRVEDVKKSRPQASPNQPVPKSQFWSYTLIFWSTFLVTVVASVPNFALAYRYSEHKRGTTEDADFWFLLQSSMTAFLSIIVSCISLSESSQVPKRVWIPLSTVGALCNILSVVFYLKLPTEWSGLLVILGSSIQAFMILQIVIGGK